MRTLKEVEQEFANLCAKAGHLSYQVYVLKADLALVNEQIKDLNYEASKIAAAERETKAAESTPTAATEEVKA